MLLKRMHYALTLRRRTPKLELRHAGRAVAKAQRDLLLSPGRILAEGSRALRLTAGHWSKHVFIAGGSGQGKSKLLELLVRQLIDQGQGGTLIDPHGDTARALLDYCAAAGIDPSRIVYLKPTTDHCFSVDLLDGAPDGDGPNRALKLSAWIDSTADRIIRAFLRNNSAADQEMMRRLKHRMRTLIWCCAVTVDGRHLGLADMKALANPRRPEFAAVLDRIGPRLRELKPEVFHELEDLRAARSETLINQWMESTTNLLDDTLGVILQLVFGQHAATIDFKAVIRERKILLVDLGETDELSRAAGNVIGGFIISFLINTARKTLEAERVDHYLIVDEAENYIGEDMRMAFAELRKFRMPVCISFQDLSCLRKGDLDLVERVVSICCLWFIFQQQDPENVEYLGKALKFGSLDMTPLLIDSTLPDGYDWVDTQGLNVGVSLNSTVSEAESATRTHSKTRQRHTAESLQESVSLALSRSESAGRTETETETETHGTGGSAARAVSRTLGVTDGQSEQDGSSFGESQSHQTSTGESRGESQSSGLTYSPGGDSRSLGRSGTHGRSEGTSNGTAVTEAQTHSLGSSHSESDSITRGRTDTESWTRAAGWGLARGLSYTRSRGLTLGLGLSRGQTRGESDGVSDGLSLGLTRGRAEGQAVSVGVTFQKTPLARHRFLKVPNGKTVVAVADQFYGVMNLLAALPERTVLMKVKGMESPFMLQVHDVEDPYAAAGQPDRSAAWRAHDRAEFLKRVYEAPFYFTPTDADHRGRVERFLGAPVEAREEARGEFPADEENPIA